jgi:TonB family protein
MSRPEFRPDDSPPDPTHILEQHLLAGFPLDLALDLVLNELVVRAAEATHASAAALALARGDEMVCRAATGPLAPDLGIPLNPRDGLSGACLQTRQPQLSVDTEFDPRVDPSVSRRRGIRSILIVPVFDTAFGANSGADSGANFGANSGANDSNAQFAGVLEVFSPSPAAFSHLDQKRLEGFAEECAHIRRAAIELSQRKPAIKPVPSEPTPSEPVPSEFTPPISIAASAPPIRRAPYEVWTLVLGGLAILATIAVSFLIGSRVGWLRPTASHAPTQLIPANSSPAEPFVAPKSSAAAKSSATRTTPPAKSAAVPSAAHSAAHSAPHSDDELVVYEKGKVIFRMKPAPAKADQAAQQPAKAGSTKQDSRAVVEASSTTKISTAKIDATENVPAKIAPAKTIPTKTVPQSVWLSSEQAETRLLSRTEPQYPPDALAAHRSGDVVLEVHVAEDGSVSNIRAVSGDPRLAAAATDAVRNWRFQPYRLHDHPTQFQTDVTLTFALPN